MANQNRWCFAWAPERTASAGTDKAALLKETMWNPGDIITVSFLDGESAVKKKVQQYAEQWTTPELANLTFEFRKDTTDTLIRISFRYAGSWSVLGSTCKRMKDKTQPTMNYGWLTPDTSDDEVRRVVLHEFGHALGLIHEHQNPKDNPIVWDRDPVIADLSGPPNNWTPEQIEFNLFQPYEEAAVQATEFDPDSIMMYPIPEKWTKNHVSFDLNSRISARDTELIHDAYA